LIEFKRKGGSLKKEIAKQHAISTVVNHEKLRSVAIPEMSRAIHWVVEFDSVNDEKRLSVRSVPYLDAFQEQSDDYHSNLEVLVESIANDACSGESRYDQIFLQAYIELLLGIERKYQTNPDASAGSILLSANSTSGIKFVQFENILELRLQHQQVIENFKKEIQQARESRQEIEFERENDLGMSR